MLREKMIAAKQPPASGLVFPSEWNEAPSPAETTTEYWTTTKFENVSPHSSEWLFVDSLFVSGASARVTRLRRVQNRGLWRDYARYRDEKIKARGDDANEKFLFHGTGAKSAEAVLEHPDGLDPRFGNGGDPTASLRGARAAVGLGPECGTAARAGFYGFGTYLAESPAYPIGGRYAHRFPGTSGHKMELMIVRSALGVQEDLGQRVDTQTRKMRMPGVRPEGPPRIPFDSVRAGPHGPFRAGGGSEDASVIHVLYGSNAMYPSYAVEFELDLGQDVISAILADESSNSTAVPVSSSTKPSMQRSASAGSQAGKPLQGTLHLQTLLKDIVFQLNKEERIKLRDFVQDTKRKKDSGEIPSLSDALLKGGAAVVGMEVWNRACAKQLSGRAPPLGGGAPVPAPSSPASAPPPPPPPPAPPPPPPAQQTALAGLASSSPQAKPPPSPRGVKRRSPFKMYTYS